MGNQVRVKMIKKVTLCYWDDFADADHDHAKRLPKMLNVLMAT